MATATNIFENKLRIGLRGVNGLSTLAAEEIQGSPNAIWTSTPEVLRDQVLNVYAHALDKVWWLCLAFGE
jgi:hypothetical protein